MFNKIKLYILKTYLLNVVVELERYSVTQKRWRTNADITSVLCRLLLANKPLVLNINTNSLLAKTVVSPYISLSDLERYVNDFLTQSKPFIKGETSNRPKIVTDVGDSIRNIDYLTFVEYTSGGFINVLDRIETISSQVKDALKEANVARRSYLESMLVPIFSVLIGLVEEMYGVL